jgi:hypothetical protein
MSKDLFMLMREQEIQTSNFLPTKKEIQFSSKRFITDLLEAGVLVPKVSTTPKKSSLAISF